MDPYVHINHNDRLANRKKNLAQVERLFANSFRLLRHLETLLASFKHVSEAKLKNYHKFIHGSGNTKHHYPITSNAEEYNAEQTN